jgi:serine/threonine-protein kinase
VICVQCQAAIEDEGARVCPKCGALQPVPERRLFQKGTTVDVGYGRVVLDERIGEGGMGVVWRGWLFFAPGTKRANDPPELVALKVLRQQAQARRELRQLFLNEADALRRLSHPNVVRYYDLIDWGAAQGKPGNLVLAMEYVQGDTLEDVIARHVARARLAGSGVLPGMIFRRAWYYFEQLLGALAAIHALGIVHRDVKPSNILVRHDGIVKLTDFGIARLGDNGASMPPPHDAAQAERAFVDLAPGTGAYMSPEQVLQRHLDARTDLYSAAIVLYEMLAGKPPFSSDRGEFMVRKDQVETTAPPIRTWLAQAPPVLDALFARALAKDPAYRFANALEMATAFRGALGMPETPEWRAQEQLAAEAAQQTDLALAETFKVFGDPAREKRLATLREFVVKGYQTARMGAM